VLKAAYTLSMTDEDRMQFCAVAQRDPPPRQVRELWVVAGRRAGKDFDSQRHCDTRVDQRRDLCAVVAPR
jgi:hypothetical protein